MGGFFVWFVDVSFYGGFLCCGVFVVDVLGLFSVFVCVVFVVVGCLFLITTIW